MANRDSKGKFIKGHPFGKRFKKGNIPWSKDKKYKCKQYNLSDEGRLQKIKNLGDYIDKSGKGCISRGYKIITFKGKQVGEHQVVWCNQEGNLPYIPNGMLVHHINRNKFDNRPQNLVLLPRNYHTSLHRTITNGGGEDCNRRNFSQG